MQKDKLDFITELTHVTGVNVVIASRIFDAGYHSIESLKNVAPEQLAKIPGISPELAIQIIQSVAQLPGTPVKKVVYRTVSTEDLSRTLIKSANLLEQETERELADIMRIKQELYISKVQYPNQHASVTRHSSLVTRHPSPVTRHSSPVTRRSSFVPRHSIYIISFVILFSIISIAVSVYILTLVPKTIIIDGNFSDWNSVVRFEDSRNSTIAPEIDIAGYANKLEFRNLFIYVETYGSMFLKTEIAALNIFVDSDGNNQTGYLINSIGANYRIEIAGNNMSIKLANLYSYQNYEDKLNWSSWQRVGGIESAFKENRLELKATLADIDSSKYRIIIVAMDNKNTIDVSEAYLGPASKLLVVSQKPSNVSYINGTTDVLELTFIAKGDTVTVEKINFQTNLNLSTLPYPIIIPTGTTIKYILRTSSSQPISQKPFAGIASEADIITNAIVTLKGDFAIFYNTKPVKIEIDGLFEDWKSETEYSDGINSIPGNIDLLYFKYTTNTVNGALAFYLNVRESLLAGSPIPQRYLPFTPCTINCSRPQIIPRISGEDIIRLYFDTDRNSNTGEKIYAIGADLKVEIRGIYGLISSAKEYKFENGLWKFPYDVLSAKNLIELEILITHINSTNIPFRIELTDWLNVVDYYIPTYLHSEPQDTLHERRTLHEARLPLYYHDRSEISFNSTEVNIGPPTTTTGRIISMTTVDLDNDGDEDVITGDDGGYIRFGQNNRDGNFTWYHPHDNNGNDLRPAGKPYALDVGDVDNDGDMDIVTGDDSNKLIVFFNSGNPWSNTWSKSTETNVGAVINDLKLVDLNRDGLLDIALIRKQDNSVLNLYMNDGDLSNGPGTSVGIDLGGGNDYALSLDSSDLDNDGDFDIIIREIVTGAGGDGKDISAWRNDGNPFDGSPGSTQIKIFSGVLTDASWGILSKELDNNGWKDFIFTDKENTQFYIYLFANDGTPFDVNTNKPSTKLQLGTNPSRGLFIEDFDNDGWNDIAVIDSGDGSTGSTLRVFENKNEISSSWQLAFIDTLSGNINQDSVGTKNIAVLDYDVDGDKDIIVGLHTGSVWLYNNTLIHRNAQFQPSMELSSANGSINDITLADLDNDGDMDIVTAENGNTSVYSGIFAYRNPGNESTFENMQFWNRYAIIQLQQTIGTAVAVSDINSDGWLDIVAGSYSDNLINKYYLLLSAESYKNPWRNGWAWDYEYVSVSDIITTTKINSIKITDLDNDGYNDIVTGSSAGELRVWRYTGYNISNQNGTWIAANLSIGQTDYNASINDIDVADLDNDGFMDIVQVNNGPSGGNEVRIYKNNHRPFFAGNWSVYHIFEMDYWNGNDDVVSIATGDFDNDGYTDIVIGRDNAGSGAPHQIHILKNDGTPFKDVRWMNRTIDRSSLPVYDLKVTDFDNDGYTDIIATYNQSSLKIYINPRSAVFSSTWNSRIVASSPVMIYRIATGNIDNRLGSDNGDSDIAFGTYTGSEGKIYIAKNIGGMATIIPSGVPKNVTPGESVDIITLNITHNGLPVDDAIELNNLTFRFLNESGQGMDYLTANSLFTTLLIIYDSNGNGQYDAGDTIVDKIDNPFNVDSDGDIAISLSSKDGNNIVAIPYGVSKIYFLVVNISSSAPLVNFTIIYDPDGLHTSMWNELENRITDKVATIVEDDSSSYIISVLELSRVIYLIVVLITIISIIFRKFLIRGNIHHS